MRDSQHKVLVVDDSKMVRSLKRHMGKAQGLG